MCVAVYKPANVKTPSLDTLKRCWDANPDGAGFALRTGGDEYAIEIHKGYMTWKQFKAAFENTALPTLPGICCCISESRRTAAYLRGIPIPSA